MPVKYHCARCGRRFVDWGAEKLGFKCPDCEDEELVRMGASEDRPAKRPSLKRGARKAVPVAPIESEEEDFYGDETVVAEVDEEVVGDEVAEEDEDEALVVVAEEESAGFVRAPAELIPSTDEDEVDLDVTEDLNFGDVAPALGDTNFDEADDENWHE